MPSATPWWRSAVLYQIYPRSFASAGGQGTGDIAGATARLEHLAWLGIDAVWLSPFYRSPMLDGGYDISCHCDVDPSLGTLADVDAFIAESHRLGIRVLVDFVPNHTSDQHPWFVESRASRDAPKRDWYIWRDEPNNWRAALIGGSAWTYDDATGQYYLHLFLPEQPDLNWANPEVVDAMHGVLRFWLARGVDGFRIDVAHCIGKDPTFADDPRCLTAPLSDFNDQPASHEYLRGIRRFVEQWPQAPVLVGEVNIRSTAAIARYYGAGDELHLSFNFPPLDAPWDDLVWRACIDDVERHLTPGGSWPTWVLSNHDNTRHRTRYGGSFERAAAAAVLLLTLRGTPFVYQGDELGLEDVVAPPERRVDPGGRDGPRAPIPWEREAPHGWPGAATFLPFGPDPVGRSAEAQRADGSSMLHLYRHLLAERRRSPALQIGGFEWLDSPPGVLFYRRADGDDERVVAVNFNDRPVEVDVDDGWVVVAASDRADEGRSFAGGIAGERAVILAPSADWGQQHRP